MSPQPFSFHQASAYQPSRPQCMEALSVHARPQGWGVPGHCHWCGLQSSLRVFTKQRGKFSWWVSLAVLEWVGLGRVSMGHKGPVLTHNLEKSRLMVHLVCRSSIGWIVSLRFWGGWISLMNFHVNKRFEFYVNVLMIVEAVRRWRIGDAVWIDNTWQLHYSTECPLGSHGTSTLNGTMCIHCVCVHVFYFILWLWSLFPAAECFLSGWCWE